MKQSWFHIVQNTQTNWYTMNNIKSDGFLNVLLVHLLGQFISKMRLSDLSHTWINIESFANEFYSICIPYHDCTFQICVISDVANVLIMRWPSL